MNRRTFNAAIAISPILFSGNLNNNNNMGEHTKTKLPRLEKGDAIGLIAPAGAISEEKIQIAVKNIEDLGFVAVEGNYLRERYGYLAGTDEQRLADVHSMYADKNIKGIWCVRGGYGCTRLLHLLDYNLIKNNPKPLIGYSDITAFHNSIYQETGIVGFHGPVASSSSNEYNNESFKSLLMEPQAQYLIAPFLGEIEKSYDEIKVLFEGSGEGRIAGGNLSLLAAMVGTKYEVDFKNKIVFIEDIGEEPYRIDRMLTQLVQGSNLPSAKAILLGQFKGCNPDDPTKSLSLIECLEDRLLPLKLPIIYGMNFGHVDHNFTFPIGAMARVDTSKLSLEILEPAVK